MTIAPTYVCGIGMSTAIGLNTVQSSASVRAGISGYAEGGILNKKFEPMMLALQPDGAMCELDETLSDLAALTSRGTRMLRLGVPALREAVVSMAEQVTIPLFLVLPEALPDQREIVGDDFLRHVIAQSGVNVCPQSSKVVVGGRAVGIVAVRDAIACLDAGEHDFVLVGGVDSHMDLLLLGLLDRDDRVLAEGVMDGFAPGEGASFLLICSQNARSQLDASRIVQLHEPGLAEEAGHRYSDAPCSGEGLTTAIRDALSGLQDASVATVMTSLNGEQLGAKEWGIALSRNAHAISPVATLQHPAECLGDLGAASAPALMALAATWLFKQQVSGPVLVGCSSEGAQRGAICLTCV